MKIWSYIAGSVLPVLFLLILPVGTINADDPIIGIVMTVKGGLIHRYGDVEEAIEPETKIYSSSRITLAEGTNRAHIQIGTDSGLVAFSRFSPEVDFSTMEFNGLTSKQIDIFIASVACTLLRARGVDKADELFDWYLGYLGAIDEKDMKEGFSIVISKNSSSAENFSLNPLYFKLKDGKTIKKTSFTLINADNGDIVYENGSFIEKDDTWIVALNLLDYIYSVKYAIKSMFRLSDNTEVDATIEFYVYGSEEIQFIEDEASSIMTGKENDFEKHLIRALHYNSYDMKFEALSIFKSLGLDLEGMIQ